MSATGLLDRWLAAAWEADIDVSKMLTEPALHTFAYFLDHQHDPFGKLGKVSISPYEPWQQAALDRARGILEERLKHETMTMGAEQQEKLRQVIVRALKMATLMVPSYESATWQHAMAGIAQGATVEAVTALGYEPAASGTAGEWEDKCLTSK